MIDEVRKWLRPAMKTMEEEDRYASLEQFFADDNETVHLYDIDNDKSWVNDVFAVGLVNGVKEGKHYYEEDFSGITLAGAPLQEAVIRDCRFIGGTLPAVDFFGSNLEGTDFSVCDLRKVDFRKCNLKNVNFKDANLAGAIFDDADLTGANFSDAYVLGTSISGAQMDEKAKSDYEKMMETIEDAENGKIPLHHLPNSLLMMLDWRRMHLGGVDLTKVDLTGISLVGVNLSGTMRKMIYIPPPPIHYDEEKPEEEKIPKYAVLERPSVKEDIQDVHKEYEFMNMYGEEEKANKDKEQSHKPEGFSNVKNTEDSHLGENTSFASGQKEGEEKLASKLGKFQKRINKEQQRGRGKPSRGKIRT